MLLQWIPEGMVIKRPCLHRADIRKKCMAHSWGFLESHNCKGILHIYIAERFIQHSFLSQLSAWHSPCALRGTRENRTRNMKQDIRHEEHSTQSFALAQDEGFFVTVSQLHWNMVLTLWRKMLAESTFLSSAVASHSAFGLFSPYSTQFYSSWTTVLDLSRAWHRLLTRTYMQG